MLARIALLDPKHERGVRLCKHLEAFGFDVQTRHHEGQLTQEVSEFRYQALILRVPPSLLSLCRNIRESGAIVPILVLADGDHYSDRVR